MRNRDRDSALQDERALEMEGGEGRTAVSMYLMPTNWTLKNG